MTSRTFLIVIALVTAGTILPASAQTIRQLTDFRAERFDEFAIDGSGAAVVVVTTADPFDSNPAHDFQAVAWSGAGTGSVLSRIGGLSGSVSVSDDGQWIAFGSVADPLGQNPDRSVELFLQSANGTILRQLTDRPQQDAPLPTHVSLSGSGNRIAFVEWDTLRIVEATGGGVSTVAGDLGTVQTLAITDDGSALVFTANGDPLGSNNERDNQVFRVAHDGSALEQLTFAPANDGTISGDGQLVAYESGGELYVLGAATGYVPIALGNGSKPSLTDDASWVYYSDTDGDNLEIYRALTNGGGAQRVTRTSAPIQNDQPKVSGDGSRLAFVRSGDGPRRLMAVNGDGAGVEQLGVAESDPACSMPDITPDGTRIVFRGPQAAGHELFRIESDGSDMVPITSGADPTYPSIVADGETIVFGSLEDLTGDNTCGVNQAFAIEADGAGLTQLTPAASCESHDFAVISRDGTTVVYQQQGGWLYKVPGGGGTPSPIVMDASDLPKVPRLSADGSLVVYQVPDADHYYSAFIASTDGSSVENLAALVERAPYPDISLAGQEVVFLDQGGCDFPCIGINLWSYHPDVESRSQITEEGVFWPRLSGDGVYVYYYRQGGLHRHEISTGAVEYAEGVRDARVPLAQTIVAVDEIGRAVFASRYNPTGGNPDLSLELWLVDFDATPTFGIAKDAPAEIRFTPDPRGLVYDVIRGDLANLRAGDVDTVDLGPVVCLADDLPSTVALDPDSPGPNHGFFYLFRWADGWGASSNGAPRIASSGDCSP